MSWAWISIVILSLYTGTAWMLLEQAPLGKRVTAIHITPGNAPIILGYAELGQRLGAGAATAKHLRVRLDTKGWWIANVSPDRRIDAPTTIHRTRYLKRWQLISGDHINIDGVTITVVAATQDSLKLQGPNSSAIWENGNLQQNLPNFTACPTEGTAWWLRHFYGQRELRLFTIGGQVPCPRRWHVPDTLTKSAEILWQNGQFWLAPGNAKAIRFTRSNTAFWYNAVDLEVRLDDPIEPTTKIVLGRTHYRPTWNTTTLTLTPTAGGDIWRTSVEGEANTLLTSQDPRVQIVFEPVNLAIGTWNLSQWLYQQWHWLLITLVLSIISSSIIIRSSNIKYSSVLKILNLITIIPALFFSSFTLTTIGINIPASLLLLNLGLAWGMVTVLLFITGRLRGLAGLLWINALGLILFGGIIQAQLGLGGNSDRWLNFATNHLRILALIGWMILPITLISASKLEQMAITLIDPTSSPKWWRWLKLIAPLLGALTLLLQMSFGSEEGLGNTQPVEGIKTLSALFIAYGGVQLWARRWGLSQFHQINPWVSILELTWGIVLFLIFVFLLLIAVRDLSPLLLLTLLMIPTLWRIATHPRQLYSLGTVILKIVLSITIFILISSLIWIKLYPHQLPHWIFQYDRLMVWAQPAQFIESGYQVHRAINFTAQGINGVSSGPFGWNGEVMNLPVIQNDFIGAFAINRFGKLGGIILLFLQFSYVGTLLAISTKCEVWGIQGNAPRQIAGVFLSLSLFALAWLFIAHSVIAWGNVLGLLPVMGQPMTFIAAGTSHLLLFAIPVLLLGLMTGWLIQSNEHYNSIV